MDEQKIVEVMSNIRYRFFYDYDVETITPAELAKAFVGVFPNLPWAFIASALIKQGCEDVAEGIIVAKGLMQGCEMSTKMIWENHLVTRKSKE